MFMNIFMATIVDCIAALVLIIDFLRVDLLGNFLSVVSVEEAAELSDFHSSIESVNSQEFSVGIFYFLVASIVVFTIFVFMFMLKDKTSKLKKGEKILFVWLLFGVVTAVAFGASQLLHGYLF